MGNAPRHVALHGVGQTRQQTGGSAGIQIRRNQGDGLGMFVPQEREELRRITAAHEAERPRPQDAGDPVHDRVRLVGAERPFQDRARIVHAAAGCRVAVQHQLLKLRQRQDLILRRDRIQPRDFQGELFYLFFVEVLEDVRGELGAKQYEKYGRLPASDEVPAACRLPTSSRLPTPCRLVVMPGEALTAGHADRLAVARRSHTTLSSRRRHPWAGVRRRSNRIPGRRPRQPVREGPLSWPSLP